ncbi:diguanylate cyclase domain-containing protein [Zoogloea sp.]|uniref:diguanylate cyclase domain-containing protein n=1 Tax=Zoogloea sp. TaxID=49181 RepID=UPI0035B1E96A
MKHPIRLPPLLLPTAVGLFSLAVTGWLWRHEQTSLDAKLRADFDFSVRHTVSRIEQRIATYEQMLRGARGLFDASDDVRPADFQRFVDALTGGAEFSGLQAVVFTRWQGDTAPVTYVAPDSPRNRRALGRDLFADLPRRTAMLQARDSGEIAITPRIALLMDQPATAPSFAIYLALYDRANGLDTPAERRAHLRGWVHIAFRLRDLMASLYGESTPGIAVSIYDDVAATPASLIFESPPEADADAPPRFSTIEYIGFPQHNWALHIRTTPAFEERHSRSPARVIAIAGGIGSLLLALFTWQLVTGRDRADARARAMTRELRESEERMRHMAQHDPLTQLPNRALFSDRLQAALALARRDRHGAALMFVDLDRFKSVNDRHGHAVGDQLLIAATTRMRDCLRESDTLARLGGDEFVVLLPHIEQPDDAERVASRIRSALAQPFALDGLRLEISASIGIGLFPEHGQDDIALMKSADDAMYRAKDIGRDRLVFAGRTP